MGFHVWLLAIGAILQGCKSMQFSYFGASFGLETSLVNATLQVHVYYRGINLPCSQSLDEICAALNCSYCRTRAVEDSNYATSWRLVDGETVINHYTNALHIRSYGCCWPPFMKSPRETVNSKFTFSLFVDLGTRSDNGAVNVPPQLPLLPILRVPQNCNSTYNLTIYEGNGDVLNCRYGLRAKHECIHCNQHHFLTLDQKHCVLQYNGLGTSGVYPVELMVEEYPRETILLAHSDGTQTMYSAFGDASSTLFLQSRKALSSIPMQFAIIVQKAISECAFGIFRPAFIHPTPPNGARIYASSDSDGINFTINAISLNERITAFTVVGPHGLHKSGTWSMDDRSVSVNVSWSVEVRGVPKQVPVCFLSTTSSGLQSEPRCIWIVLNLLEEQSLAPDLQCLSNAMILSAPRNLAANLPDDSLQLNDASCKITGNSTHLLLTIPLSECGTELLEDETHYIFTNKIVSQNRNKTSKQLKRVAIPLMCKFLRSGKGSEQVNVLSDAINKIFEVYSFEIQFSKEFNSSWSTAGPDSPFNATSKDYLYMSIIAKSNETALSLHVESCQILKEYNSSTGVTLLRQGCLNISTAKEHQTENQKEKVYSIKLSSLPWRTGQVFVNCSVQLCARTASSSSCTVGCGSGSGSQAQQSNMQQVSAGPVHITKESDFGANYAVITVGLALGGTVIYIVLILLKRSFVGLYYKGNTRSTRSRRF